MNYSFEWIDGPSCTDSDWERVESILATKGWVSLNRNSTRVLIARAEDGAIVGFNVLQLMPYVGPLFVVPSARATGLAAELVDRMLAFLAEIQARGFLAIAQSPHTEQMCEKVGMKRVESPVFVMGGTT